MNLFIRVQSNYYNFKAKVFPENKWIGIWKWKIDFMFIYFSSNELVPPTFDSLKKVKWFARKLSLTWCPFSKFGFKGKFGFNSLKDFSINYVDIVNNQKETYFLNSYNPIEYWPLFSIIFLEFQSRICTPKQDLHYRICGKNLQNSKSPCIALFQPRYTLAQS